MQKSRLAGDLGRPAIQAGPVKVRRQIADRLLGRGARERRAGSPPLRIWKKGYSDRPKETVEARLHGLALPCWSWTRLQHLSRCPRFCRR